MYHVVSPWHDSVNKLLWLYGCLQLRNKSLLAPYGRVFAQWDKGCGFDSHIGCMNCMFPTRLSLKSKHEYSLTTEDQHVYMHINKQTTSQCHVNVACEILRQICLYCPNKLLARFVCTHNLLRLLSYYHIQAVFRFPHSIQDPVSVLRYTKIIIESPSKLDSCKVSIKLNHCYPHAIYLCCHTHNERIASNEMLYPQASYCHKASYM